MKDKVHWDVIAAVIVFSIIVCTLIALAGELGEWVFKR